MKLPINRFHLILSMRTWFVAGFVALAALTGLFFMNKAFADSPATAVDERLVTIHDSGTEATIVTRASTVGEALKDAGVTTASADIVEPARGETLVAKSYQVNIFRARPVVVEDGTTSIRVMTAEQSPRQIAKAAKLTLNDEDITILNRVDDVLNEGGAGLKLTIDRAVSFNFTLYGKRFESHTQATTVAGVLKEKGVKLGANDGVFPAIETSVTAGMELRVWRNGKQTVTIEEVIAKPIEEVKDTAHELGYRAVKEAGQDGKRNVTYEIEMRDGVEVTRVEIASVTTTEPVREVVTVGAKILGSYTSPSQNESITWEFLMNQGFTREQTAGIMGNLKQEHGFNTTGDGLAQWTGGRKAKLMAMPDPYNIYTQLQFLMIELNGPYAKARDAIKASTTVEQAVIIFQNQFERCGICAESKRIQYAYNILASH